MQLLKHLAIILFLGFISLGRCMNIPAEIERKIQNHIKDVERNKSLVLYNFTSESQLESKYFSDLFSRDLKNLQEIKISHYNHLEIPTEIFNLKELSKLNLSSNQIENIPVGIEKLEKLYKLDLSFNQLKEVPVGIEKLENLSELYLNNNQIENISSEIENLTKLRTLYLHNNQYETIPAGIGNITSLIELSIDLNGKKNILKVFYKLNRIIFLYIFSNELESIPSEIGAFENLCILILCGNNLKKLPTELCQLKHLEQLSLGGNKGLALNYGKEYLNSCKNELNWKTSTLMELSRNLLLLTDQDTTEFLKKVKEINTKYPHTEPNDTVSPGDKIIYWGVVILCISIVFAVLAIFYLHIWK